MGCTLAGPPLPEVVSKKSGDLGWGRFSFFYAKLIIPKAKKKRQFSLTP